MVTFTECVVGFPKKSQPTILLPKLPTVISNKGKKGKKRKEKGKLKEDVGWVEDNNQLDPIQPAKMRKGKKEKEGDSFSQSIMLKD